MKTFTFRIRFLLVAVFMLFVFGCSDEVENNHENESLTEMYQDAVEDAMIAEADEISDDLIAILPTNTYLSWKEIGGESYVLVATLTKYDSSYPVDSSVTMWWGETWVTAVPELKDWFADHPKEQTDPVLRCEQLLGMPDVEGNFYFAEIWVKPDDLFRPTPDAEITDQIADLTFPDGTDEFYKTWFNNNIIYSYYPEPTETAYPWTRLGYTYDWGNSDSEIGLSEFVIRKNAKVVVEAVETVSEYIQ